MSGDTAQPARLPRELTAGTPVLCGSLPEMKLPSAAKLWEWQSVVTHATYGEYVCETGERVHPCHIDWRHVP